jgi:hypothetical protein
MKGFAEAGQNLAFLNRETGLSVNLLRQLDAAGEHLGGNMDSINQGFAKFAGITEQLRMNRTPGGIVDLLGHDTTGSLHRLVETLRHETDSTKALFDALGELPNIKSIQQRKAFLSDLGIDQVFANYTPSMLAEVKKNLGDVPKGAIENAVALKDAFDQVGDSIKKIKDDIYNYVSSPLTKALNLLREFMQQHEGLAIGLSGGGAVAGGFAAYKLGGALIRGMLGGGAAAAGPGIISRLGAGVAGGAAFAGPGGIAAGLLLGGSTGTNEDVSELVRQRRYGHGGLGHAQRALMARAGHDGLHPISGAFADIAQNYRGEESTYKAVLRGSREGTIEAFQWLKRLQEGGGAGGIISAAYHPGEGEGLGGGAAGAGGGLGGAGGG